MTITDLTEQLRRAVKQSAEANFGVTLDNVVAEMPPKTELGDLAFPAAFEMAKLIKQQTGEKSNPRAVAEKIKADLEQIPGVSRIEIAGPGYLNVFFDRGSLLIENLGAAALPERLNKGGEKICVEHTSVNPNKAAHIGHVRNAVLGDTFSRMLRAEGKTVEVQYYIDNTGVQVADVVIAFIYLEKLDLAGVKELDSALREKNIAFDHFCWDLYARVGQEYARDEQLKEKRGEVLHLIEEGGNPTAELAEYVSTRNVECIVDTMERFSIRYDLLPRESEILHLNFWQHAFERMKELNAIHYENDGKHAGCWVMPFDTHAGTDDHEANKILVRSNGTVTYTGKDIAYQMWKLGLLDLDFYYKPFHKYTDGSEVWTTTADVNENSATPGKFGGGERVYNVIDSRQSYPQEVVKKGIAAIDREKGEEASIHLSYEMVALSPAAAAELGFEVTDEDRAKPFIEMSGRKGLGVKADDLLTRLEENAYAEVASRHADISEDEKRHIAHQLAVGGLRYFLLKFTRNTVIVFDFKEALSFEGETGCFCQYSAVRANSIFRKIAGQNVETVELTDADAVGEILANDPTHEIWTLISLALRLEETIANATAANEPAILAKYAFSLAKTFNLFYHNNKIIAEPDLLRRSVLVAAARIALRSLETALATMGIEVPEKM
jgi:arginyl-tRNA synthetase